MENVRTVLMDLPIKIKGFVIKKDDYYTICLNQNLSYNQNMKSYKHELDHIVRGDFDMDMTADQIEILAHQIR